MKQKVLLPFVSIFLLLLSSHGVLSQSTQEQAKNIQKVRNYWEEVWSKGNLQAVAEFYHPTAKHGDDFTIEGFQKGVQSQREAVPDFKVTIIDIFATGDKVISEVTYGGTHTGRRFFGQDPLAGRINVPGIDIFTFKNGKCINHQHVADHLFLIRQIGIKLVPTRDPKVAEQEIMKAGRDYLELIKRLNSGKTYDELVKSGDIEAFTQVLADEYLYTDPKGLVYNKSEELDFYKKTPFVLKSVEIENQKARIDGNNAVETGVIRYIGTNGGNAIDFKKSYTTTWVWRGGRWQIIADHASETRGKTTEMIKQEVLNAGREYNELMKRLKSGKSYTELVKNGDIAALEKLLAEEYIYTSRDGIASGKKESFEEYKKNKISKYSADILEQQVRMLDEKAAVETGSIHYKGVNEGKLFDIIKRYTTTWVFRDGRWKIIADHTSKSETP